MSAHADYTTPPASQWRAEMLYDMAFAPELKAVADAIDRLGLWAWIRDNPPPADAGYLFWRHPQLAAIVREVEGGERRHSGASFALAMRHMQYIATNGFDAWNKRGGTPKAAPRESATRETLKLLRRSMDRLMV